MSRIIDLIRTEMSSRAKSPKIKEIPASAIERLEPSKYVVEYLRTDSIVIFVKEGKTVGALDGEDRDLGISREMKDALCRLSSHDFILAGEIASGRAYISDILYLNGSELMSRTWIERRKFIRKMNYSD